jgi:hypothetical protein
MRLRAVLENPNSDLGLAAERLTPRRSGAALPQQQAILQDGNPLQRFANPHNLGALSLAGVALGESLFAV